MSRERSAPQTGAGESPWSKEAPPSALLPPPQTGVPPTAAAASGWGLSAGLARRHRAGAALRWIAVVGLSAAVASALTMALRSENIAPAPAQSSSAARAAPQFSVADAATAKQNLCHVFDVSVGQKAKADIG